MRRQVFNPPVASHELSADQGRGAPSVGPAANPTLRSLSPVFYYRRVNQTLRECPLNVSSQSRISDGAELSTSALRQSPMKRRLASDANVRKRAISRRTYEENRDPASYETPDDFRKRRARKDQLF